MSQQSLQHYKSQHKSIQVQCSDSIFKNEQLPTTALIKLVKILTTHQNEKCKISTLQRVKTK